VLTSDYVYDEAVTLTRRRTGDPAAAHAVSRRIRGEGSPDVIDLVYASSTLFEEAVKIHETYAEQAFSFTDAMSVAMVKHYDADAILSFDDDFDGVVDRIGPAPSPMTARASEAT